MKLRHVLHTLVDQLSKDWDLDVMHEAVDDHFGPETPETLEPEEVAQPATEPDAAPAPAPRRRAAG